MKTHISINSKSIKYDVIEIQSLSMSDPTLSDMDFKNKMAWVRTTLKMIQLIQPLNLFMVSIW